LYGIAYGFEKAVNLVNLMKFGEFQAYSTLQINSGKTKPDQALAPKSGLNQLL